MGTEGSGRRGEAIARDAWRPPARSNPRRRDHNPANPLGLTRDLALQRRLSGLRLCPLALTLDPVLDPVVRMVGEVVRIMPPAAAPGHRCAATERATVAHDVRKRAGPAGRRGSDTTVPQCR